VSADLERLSAAQEKAEAVVRAVADHDGSDAPRLLVAVIDQETNTRLATGFVTYGPARSVRHLRIAGEA
jgi:hypothetical protein